MFLLLVLGVPRLSAIPKYLSQEGDWGLQLLLHILFVRKSATGSIVDNQNDWICCSGQWLWQHIIFIRAKVNSELCFVTVIDVNNFWWNHSPRDFMRLLYHKDGTYIRFIVIYFPAIRIKVWKENLQLYKRISLEYIFLHVLCRKIDPRWFYTVRNRFLWLGQKVNKKMGVYGRDGVSTIQMYELITLNMHEYK